VSNICNNIYLVGMPSISSFYRNNGIARNVRCEHVLSFAQYHLAPMLRVGTPTEPATLTNTSTQLIDFV